MTTVRMSVRGSCTRQSAYALLGFPPRPTRPESKVIMGMGNVAEIAIIPMLLEDRGYTIENHKLSPEGQKTVTLGDQVGHPDGIITAPGNRRLLEVKSTNPQSFARMRAEGIAKASPHFLHQVDGYMRALGLTECEFWIINRTTGEHFHTIVPFDADRFIEREFEINWLINRVEQNELPDPEYDGTDWHCSPAYCPFADICPSGDKWKELHGAKEILADGDGVIEGVEREVLEIAAARYLDAIENKAAFTQAEEEAKEVFFLNMRKHGLKELTVGGVRASQRKRTNITYDKKELERRFSQEELEPTRKVSESTWVQLEATSE